MPYDPFEFEKKQEEKRNKVVSIGGEAFIECLSKFGPSITLDFLCRLSNKGDWVATELLVMYPSTVSMAELFKHMTTFEVDPEVVARKLLADPNWLKKCGVM